MALFNEFRIIGICCGDAQEKVVSQTRSKTYFTVAVDSSSGVKKNFIPVVAPSKIAEKALHHCRNGNLIAVIGEMVSREQTDFATGKVEISMYFLATSIQLITKAERKEISNKQFLDEISKMPMELER